MLLTPDRNFKEQNYKKGGLFFSNSSACGKGYLQKEKKLYQSDICIAIVTFMGSALYYLRCFFTFLILPYLAS